MKPEGLLAASFHASQARYHREELNQLKNLTPGRMEETSGLTYSERFDRLYWLLRPYLAESSHTGHYETPKVPIRGAHEGRATESWLQFSVTSQTELDDQPGLTISYSAGTGPTVASRFIDNRILSRIHAEAFDANETDQPWPLMDDLEETLEAFRQALEQLSPEEMRSLGVTPVVH